MWKLPSRHGSIVFLNPQNCSITHIFHVTSVWFCSGGEWTGFLFLLNWASDSVGLIISSVGTEIQAQISCSHSISHQVLAPIIVFSLCNEAKSNSNSGSMSSSVPPTLLNPREKPYSYKSTFHSLLAMSIRTWFKLLILWNGIQCFNSLKYTWCSRADQSSFTCMRRRKCGRCGANKFIFGLFIQCCFVLWCAEDHFLPIRV